ncbi:MAG: 30S ribosomal protein S8 [Myxococcales bacterium]|nr:30S ribosomal protein S8 [Myxococcales bacterium]USN50902.1 MAG: 30S ribosomal protein S8 [Myxococcales bacterium]
MVNDPIADFLTRIRNGVLGRKQEVLTNCSKMSKRIAEILENAGYIAGFSVEKRGPASMMRVSLRYDSTGKSVIEGLKRVSRPGLRAYSSSTDLPVVRSGMGLSIISTSKGVMTGVEARKQSVGGEVLCLVW